MRINSFRLLLIYAFRNKMLFRIASFFSSLLIFIPTSIIIIIVIIFRIILSFLHFQLVFFCFFFRSHIVLKDESAVYARHRQLLRNTERSRSTRLLFFLNHIFF